MILTDAGQTVIEDIKAGDLVWAWDENTGKTELKHVVETYINKSDELVHIGVSNEEITCTSTHPFYVPEKGWVKAIELRAGDVLQTVNGQRVIVEWIQHEILESPVKVYNFQVEDDHTYYVSGVAILVHNSNCGPVDRMSNREANEIKRVINGGGEVTFRSKEDAVKFISKYYPDYPQEIPFHRSAKGWHFDFPGEFGPQIEHINIYNKAMKFFCTYILGVTYI